jgi:peptidoglycan hydrolase-like protein with peptidoglycan-binding domain
VITTYDDSQRFTSGPQPEPDIACLHTTEGMSWPGYSGGGEAPHKTIRATGRGNLTVRRHIPLGQYAKALMNLPGGVETNRRGVVQVELVGTCDPKHKDDPAWYYWPDADDATLKALADELRPDLTLYGIALDAPPFLPYPASYGSRSGQRFSFAKWLGYSGIVGHQHVPENDHGDPGAFPVDRLIAFLRNGSAGPVRTAVRRAARTITRAALVVDGAMGPKTVAQWQRVMGTPVDGRISVPSALVRAVQARLGFTGRNLDGRLGPMTWSAVQRRLGVRVTGRPDTTTIKALQRRLNAGQF